MDNPWGAPDDSSAFSLPAPLSPKFSLPSPPLAFDSSSSTGWGGADDGGWGGTVDDYVPGGFSASAEAEGGGALTEREERAPQRRDSDAGGWGAGSPELSRLPLPGASSTEAEDEGFAPSPPLPLVVPPTASLSPPTLASSPVPGDEGAPENQEDDGRGWGGAAEDDLPPISSLRISSPSPSPDSADRDSGWLDPAEAPGWEPPELPDALPSFGDAFERAKTPRRVGDGQVQVGADGDEAWGSAQGWEERKRREEQEREEEEARLVKEAVERAERLAREDEEQGAAVNSLSSTAAADSARSLFRLSSVFTKNAAAKSAEAAKAAGVAASDAASRISSSVAREEPPKTGMSSIQGAVEEKGRAGDEFDVDAPGRQQPKSSWWSRGRTESAAADETAPGPAKQDEEPERVASPCSEQQVGAVGRFFGRFKRPASAPIEGQQQEQAGQRSEDRTSSDAGAGSSGVEFAAADFDVLASGGIAQLSRPKEQTEEQGDELGDFLGAPATSTAGRLGSLGRRAALQRLAQAPPEDDFGGLLGAFSAPPATAHRQQPARKTSALDPFDPLSEAFTAPSAPAPLPPATANAGTASFPSLAPPQPPTAIASASSPLDEFDAFFDSVAASTAPKPAIVVPLLPSSLAARPAVHAPTPRTRPPAPSRSSLASRPPPRVATMSPPLRTSSASPSSSSSASRAATPILPLAPPPPPSQPLASSRGGSGGLISVASPQPPPPSSSAPSVQQRASMSTTPLAPLPDGGAKPPPPRPAQQPAKASGPLSLDDLSFFES
ncbi:hypothetical protein JCM10213_008819 [Rhodosporidiobolus nylandii]